MWLQASLQSKRSSDTHNSEGGDLPQTPAMELHADVSSSEPRWSLTHFKFKILETIPSARVVN